jgi:hypothetical protein
VRAVFWKYDLIFVDISTAVLSKDENGNGNTDEIVFISESEREQFINALVLKPRDQLNEEAVRRAFNAMSAICEYSRASENLKERAHNRISTSPHPKPNILRSERSIIHV